MNKTKDIETIVASQKNKERDYWLKKLSGNFVKSTFPRDTIKPNPAERAIVEFNLPGELAPKLNTLSNNSEPRLFIVLLAALVALIKKYTDTTDILVGVPVIKQKIEANLINTILTLRNEVEDGITFKELILKVRQTMVEATENQNYPISALLFELNMTTSPSEFPLFDIAVLLENIHSKSYLNNVPVNILFSFMKTGESIRGVTEYNPGNWKRETIKRISNHFEQLLQGALSNIDILLSNIELLSRWEKKQLLFDFNDTKKAYHYEKTLHELFQDQVDKFPCRISLVFDDGQLTYKKLDERTNRLAAILRQKGIEPDNTVGLLYERSLDSIVGILAVLKAGGAYLPVSLRYPADGIKYILQNSDTRLILTKENFFNRLHNRNAYDTIDINNVDAFPTGSARLEIVNSSADLAYVIYTSGSTGKPKGVMMEHRNVHNLVVGLNERIYRKYGEYLNVCMVAPFEFDASVQQIFAALLRGHRLYIVPDEARLNGSELLDYYLRHEIEISDGTPTHIRLLVDSLDGKIAKLYIKHFLIAGEEFPKKLAQGLLNSFTINVPNVSNIYGPTETCVDSTLYDIPEECTDELTTIPIGKPLPNECIYILDKENRLQPLGIIGELCIGGDGTARGYLNYPELTSEKFLKQVAGAGDRCKEAPWKETPAKKIHMSHMTYKTYIYKTGDLARYMADGNIEFLGRIDHQVKIRGFRIELGEIENRLLDHAGIKDTVVLAREHEQGDKYLCAYIVSHREYETWELREYLSKELPDYMIPTYFVSLEKMPFTSNGKIDRRTLPKPALDSGDGYTGPRDEIEKKLVKLWSGILKIEEGSISIDSSFFQLGGHSLKVTVLAAKIHKELKVKLPLAELFKTSTIRGLSAYIRRMTKEKYESIVPLEEKEYYLLSWTQKRLYILQQMDIEGTGYNISINSFLDGQLNVEKLENAFVKLIERHESLRTSFEMIGQEPVQKIQKEVEFQMEKFEASQAEVEDTVKNFLEPFDLSKASLLRVGLIKIEDKKHILMINVHHIISDAISQSILIEDFVTIYQGEQVSPLKLQYKDFSAWQRGQLHAGHLKKQEKYWLSRFRGDIPLLDISTDYPRPVVQRFEGRTISSEIDAALTGKLKTIAKEQGATLFMVLLAIFTLLMSKYTAQDDIIVGSPVAGRRHADLDLIVGMFINVLLMRNTISEKKSFAEFLEQVKYNTWQAFENQDYSIDHLAGQLDIKRDAGRNPLYEVIFAMISIENREFTIPGLKLKPFIYTDEAIKTDLRFGVTEVNEKIVKTLTYSTTLFKKETAENMLRHYKEITEQVVTHKEIKLEDIKISHDLVGVSSKIFKEDHSEFDFL